MIKRLCCIALSIMLLLSTCILGVSAENNENKSIKKIVSIVYDDSGSMNNKNEDWAYASYSLQNLIGLMNPQDELSVVKMSSPNQTTSFDLSASSSRGDGIKDVETWRTPGGSTPFTAVNTAAEWIKEKKSGYAETQSVEFWLVIITDGAFETGYPRNMNEYLNELKGAMGNSKFESIFVAIGNNVPNYVKNDWTSVTGNHLITSANSNDIVNAMSDVSALILGQGGKSTSVNVSITSDGKGITFNPTFPLKKFIVFEQNQNVGISSIEANGVPVEVTADFSANKPGKGTINSRTIHCGNNSGDYIPTGQITVKFDSKIDTSSNKFKILMDSAVNVDFKVLDKSGKEITNADEAGLIEGDLVEFTAVITNSIDKTPINLKNWAGDLSGQLIVNDQVIDMQYNPTDNAFYGSFNITSGSNIAYAIVTLPGYFRAKSDVINIYPIEVIENPTVMLSDNTLGVPYKYCEEFEEIGAFTYTVSGGTINGICDFEFKNMPKGITASVNGIFANEEGKLSVKVHNDVPADVKFYRNKDYTETEESKIAINVSSNQYVLKWKADSITEIILKPMKRAISLEVSELKDSGDLTLSNFSGKAIYIVSVIGNGEYLTAEELATLDIKTDNLRGISFKSEIVEYNGRHALQLSCKKKLPQIFVKTGDIDSNIVCTTVYDEESTPAAIKLNIKDSGTKYIMPILLLLLLVLLLGHLPPIKKRLRNNKYHIRVNDEDEAIYVNAFSRLVPFIPEKGSGGGLTLTATSNKNKVLVANDFFEDQEAFLDGEKVQDNIIELSTGSELIVKEKYTESKYSYCDSRDDDSFGDAFGDFSDTDDFFSSSSSSTSDSSSDNDFFN